jgi:pseudomonalisin
MRLVRSWALKCAIGCALLPFVLQAQSADAVAASAQVRSSVDVSQRSPLALKHMPDWATVANDRGALAASRRLDNLHLVLARAPQVEAAFQQRLQDQQNPASPYFHQWLTPAQNAAEFGVAASDVAAVTGWLQSQGLQVQDVAGGGVFVTFSGTVAQIGAAFGTSLHSFEDVRSQGSASPSGTVLRYAPTSEPTVPAALAAVIRVVSGLDEHYATPLSQVRALPQPLSFAPTAQQGTVMPAFTSTTGSHALAPADFNTIYDVPSTLTGGGTHAAVLISSRIVASDITDFNSFFGLSVAQPNTIVIPSSTDPGVSSGTNGTESEADLDVQRILGTAPGATVDLLVFSSLSDQNIESALQYNLSTLNDPIVNMSFGSCDYGSSGLTEDQTYNSYASSLAAQGVSITVASGDDGAAACDSASTTSIPSTQYLSTNVICASSYVTCVGGTEFNDTASPTSYWAPTNNATTKASALGYIPEGAWNEPSQTSAGKTTYEAAASGGGVSKLAKPYWQTGTGVPADGLRDVPDVSFTAAGHDGYLVCEADISDNCSTGSFKYVILGTSASAPSTAGVAALLIQKLGTRQGNLNPMLYSLAGNAGNAASVIHDATPASSGVSTCSTAVPSMCNNSTPSQSSLSGGLAGYPITTGYDLVTGLGSLDVGNLVAAAALTATAPGFTLAASPSALTVTAGATTGDTSALTVTGYNSFAGTVNLSCTASLNGGTASLPPVCTVNPASVTLAANGTATATVTLTTQASRGCTAANVVPEYPGWERAVSFAGLFFLLLPVARRRNLGGALLLLAVAAMLPLLSGCGGSSSTGSAPICNVISAGTTAGTYTLTLSGTGTSTGAVTSSSAAVPLMLTVQ